jgi:hypothetical protein
MRRFCLSKATPEGSPENHLVFLGNFIAPWLGHECPETTNVYLQFDLALKEKALAKTMPARIPPAQYRPEDSPVQFLNAL